MLLAFNLTEKKLTMSFDFVTTYSFHLKISHSVPYLDHKKCNDLRYVECEQKKDLARISFLSL